MKIRIKEKAAEVFFENRFFKTEEEIDIPFSMATRLARIYKCELNTNLAPYDSELFRDKKYFGFTSDIDRVSGWGNVTFNLLKNSADYDIALLGRLQEIYDNDIWRMAKRELEENGAMIWHEQPKETWENSSFPKNIAIVPFETTVIPQSWIKRINNFDALIVPCLQNKETFETSGVKIPIEIVQWGYQPELFSPIERPQRSTFTFGTMGALSIRKGTDVLINAFREAFPPDITDVRLICKTSYHNYPFMVKDKRIVVQMTPVTHQELMRDFFAETDCFVFPTRGEGCGMPVMEAMATGLPAIVTGWSGPLEYMDEKYGWFINHGMSPATDFTEKVYKEDCGEWAEPDKDHLVKLMRYAYEHRDEAREKGKAAAEYMKENWTWKQRISKFHDVLKKYL